MGASSAATTRPGQVYTRDIATLYQTGPNAAAGERTFNDKWDTSATVTIYRPDFFLGNHQFETGFSYWEDTLGRAYPITEDTPPFNGQLLFNNGAPLPDRPLQLSDVSREPNAVCRPLRQR